MAVAKRKVVKRYAEGGAVERRRSDVPTFTESVKRLFSTEKSPGLLGDAIKKRESRMEAMERGEPDPGQNKPKPDAKLARGGKVRKK